MCVVCQNVPAVMTGLSGAGLMVRAAIRRSSGGRDDVACTTAPPEDALGTAPAALPATPVGAR